MRRTESKDCIHSTIMEVIQNPKTERGHCNEIILSQAHTKTHHN